MDILIGLWNDLDVAVLEDVFLKFASFQVPCNCFLKCSKLLENALQDIYCSFQLS